MLGVARVVAIVGVVAMAADAVATTPRMPLVSARTSSGVWEGLCHDADDVGIITFVVRLRIAREGSGTLALGLWFGGADPFLGQVLRVGELDVKGGRLKAVATSATPNGWSKVDLSGTGRAFQDAGWLRLHLEIAATAYKCDGILVKGNARENPFKQISAAVSRLNDLERDAAAASAERRPTGR